jgi:hypothetical protein
VKKHRIVWSTLLLVFALWSQASQFAQDTSTRAQEPDRERRASMVGLVRTISTIEVTDFSQYGSYESWQSLRERHLARRFERVARKILFARRQRAFR